MPLVNADTKTGSLYSKDLRVYGHGDSFIASSLSDAKEGIKRRGWTKGTVQKVASYYPLNADGNDDPNSPLLWKDLDEPRPFYTTKRGAFKWGDSLAVSG